MFAWICKCMQIKLNISNINSSFWPLLNSMRYTPCNFIAESAELQGNLFHNLQENGFFLCQDIENMTWVDSLWWILRSSDEDAKY